MQWHRRPEVELFLDRLDIPWKWVEEMPFEKIDLRKSLKNQARIIGEQLIDEVVEQYAFDMRDRTASFAAMVWHKNGNGKGYTLDDGNHRAAAFVESGNATPGAVVAGYQLDGDNEMLIHLATRSLNRLNGVQQSKDEATQQAIQTLERWPSLSKKEVASIFRLDLSSINRGLQYREVTKTLQERRVKAEALPQTSILELGKLKNEPVLAHAADLAVGARLSVAEVKELVASVARNRSESTQHDAIRKFEEDRSRYAPQAVERKSTVKANYNRALHSLITIVKQHPSLGHLHFTAKSEVEEARRDWNDLREAMERIFA